MIRAAIRKKLSASFTLEAEFESGGATLGILGRSGSGKSMTLKCIAGVETPDEGVIIVNGRTLYDSAAKINLRPQQRKVGYLFQHYALFPRMTVLQNIMAPARGGRASRAAHKDAARRLIEQFSLTGLERRLPEEISGGQQQRCALARLLITSPDVILLDEPFSALDAQLREKMQAEFIGLLRTFPDSILVTHSRDEAYKLCAEIAVMQNGRITRRDQARALFLRPGTVAVAEITGCKNISPVEKIAHNAVYAHAWGLRLVTGEPVDEGVTHIGIRAHDFLPASHDGESNVITLDVKLENDEPFEKAVIFTNRDAADKAGQNELWWKFSKYLYHDIPARIRVPPERILLLRQS